MSCCICISCNGVWNVNVDVNDYVYVSAYVTVNDLCLMDPSKNHETLYLSI